MDDKSHLNHSESGINTSAMKTEAKEKEDDDDDDDDDVPLADRMKRLLESDDEDDLPLAAIKKPKKKILKERTKIKSDYDDGDEEEDFKPIASPDKFPLESLPTLAVEVIAQYLDVTDLAACCAVSRGVRELFDDNLLWKPHCDKELAQYLMETPCKVQPEFVSPEIPDSGLSAISHWRLAYMAENHLWNNLRQRNYKEEISGDYIRFLTNDSIMASCEGNIVILSVSKFPTKLLVPPIPRLQNCNYYTAEDKIVAVGHSDNYVQIYQLDFVCKKWYIKHSFFINQREKENSTKSFKSINMCYFHSDLPLTCNTYLFGHFLVGVIWDESTMHIWNVDTGIKLKEEICLGNQYIRSIKPTVTKDLIISVEQEGIDVTTLLCYSLYKLTFLPFKVVVKCNPISFRVFGDYVCIASYKNWERELLVYNHQTSELLLTFRPDTLHYKVVRNSLVLLHDSSLKWFNTRTRSFDLLMEDVTWFKILSDKLILVTRRGIDEAWKIGNTLISMKKLPMESNGFWNDIRGFNKVSSSFLKLDFDFFVEYLLDDCTNLYKLITFW